ncbi:DUF2059 domain-containing protein [Aurantiacibacter sediminis]|uniref:Nuclear transport factor 2 family protein n=1 Tax=Aurantiacibacter sediminis TaxID=2793064 RepID=A0ABS0N1L1_9SPHN|nr:hypothetical protein [Aurantiacibacter sediminis]MBH5321849.1 hypothetical protein [Aurantiacibacter sediminis]
MRKLISSLFAALAFTLSAPAIAQSDRQAEEPIQTVVAFMNAFDAADEAAMMELLVDQAPVAFIEEREGEDRVGLVPLSALAQHIVNSPVPLQEPIWNLRGFEDGPVAVVTANFEFLIDGNRSHCGVNIFTLMRVEGEWKIATVTYSHITEGCSEN